MSKDDITLSLEKRDVVGKGLAELRKDGRVPAVIHNHGEDSVVVSAPYIDLLKVYQQAGKHHPVNLTVGSDKYLALIREADFEPKKNQLRHIVFSAIRQNEKQQTEVPIHFAEGEIPAEKAGLMVIRQLEAVEIEALPKDLVDELTVDVSALAEIGDKVVVADIKVPEGVTILTEPEHPIATVEETKAQISEEAAEEEAAEGEEGEAAEGAEAESGEAKESSSEE